MVRATPPARQLLELPIGTAQTGAIRRMTPVVIDATTGVTTIRQATASRILFFFGRDEALRIDGVAPVLAYPRPVLTLAWDVGDGNDLVRRGITCPHLLPFTYSQFNVGVVQTVSLDFSVTGRTVITGDPTASVRLPCVKLSGLGLACLTSRTFSKGVWAYVRTVASKRPS